MNQKKHEEVFFNRAKIEAAATVDCEYHDERAVFAMRDSHGNLFSVGLSTILDCVYFSIIQGYLPKLPSSWLRLACSAYESELTNLDEICYNECNEKLD